MWRSLACQPAWSEDGYIEKGQQSVNKRRGRKHRGITHTHTEKHRMHGKRRLQTLITTQYLKTRGSACALKSLQIRRSLAEGSGRGSFASSLFHQALEQDCTIYHHPDIKSIRQHVRLTGAAAVVRERKARLWTVFTALSVFFSPGLPSLFLLRHQQANAA